MDDSTIIFKTTVETFSKRLMRLFGPYLFIYLSFLLIPLINLPGNKYIIIFSFIVITIFILLMFFSSYKWELKKVSLITYRSGLFNIEIIEKDVKKTYAIHKDNSTTNLNWKGGRPRVLTLAIFDGTNKVADLYSGGRQKNEYELEEIVFKLNQNR